MCVADIVVDGDYVDVRGVFEDYDSRTETKDLVRALEDGTATILGISNILLTGQTEKEIETQIRNELENPGHSCRNFVGKTLTKLSVSILRTEEKLERVSMRTSIGLPQGQTGHCSGLLEQLERKNQNVELVDQT
jgi:hypothetical protein